MNSKLNNNAESQGNTCKNRLLGKGCLFVTRLSLEKDRETALSFMLLKHLFKEYASDGKASKRFKGVIVV